MWSERVERTEERKELFVLAHPDSGNEVNKRSYLWSVNVQDVPLDDVQVQCAWTWLSSVGECCGAILLNGGLGDSR